MSFDGKILNLSGGGDAQSILINISIPCREAKIYSCEGETHKINGAQNQKISSCRGHDYHNYGLF